MSDIVFQSVSSKIQAENSVNKLLADLLPGTELTKGKGKTLSSAELLNKNITAKHKLSQEEIRSFQKKQKNKERKISRKELEINTRVNKVAKFQVIKRHSEDKTITADESKYLKKLVNKNSRSVNSWSIDEEQRMELKNVQKDILNLKHPKSYNKSKRTKNRKKAEFDEKIKKGYISYPGLTPGLAPVGLDDSEDDSEDEQD